MIDQAIHFWRSGAGGESGFEHINYKGRGKVPTIGPAWMNVMKNISHMAQEEKVITEKNGRHRKTGWGALSRRVLPG